MIKQHGEDVMLAKKYDTGLSMFFIIFGAIIIILSFTVKTRTVLTIGPGFMPRVIGIIVFVLGLLLFYQNYKRTDFAGKESSTHKDITEPFSWPENSKFTLISTILLLVIYVGLLETLGFPLMTAIYLLIQFFLLAEKKTFKMFSLLSGAAVVGSTIITLIFTKLLGLYLPLGILG